MGAGAFFGGACFGGAFFGGACFGGAFLGGACFGGACLGGACFGGACFGGIETLAILSGLFCCPLGGEVAFAGGGAPPAPTVTVTVAVVTEVETSCTVTVLAGCARFVKLLKTAMSRSCRFIWCAYECQRQERSDSRIRTSIPPARVDSHKARNATTAAGVNFMIV